MGNEVSQIDSAKPHPILSKDSERREQSQIYLNYAEPHPIFAHSAKIAKGERRSKFIGRFTQPEHLRREHPPAYRAEIGSPIAPKQTFRFPFGNRNVRHIK